MQETATYFMKYNISNSKELMHYIPSHNTFIIYFNNYKCPQINQDNNYSYNLLLLLQFILKHTIISHDEIGRPSSERIINLYNKIRDKFITYNNIFISSCNDYDKLINKLTTYNSTNSLIHCKLCYSDIDNSTCLINSSSLLSNSSDLIMCVDRNKFMKFLKCIIKPIKWIKNKSINIFKYIYHKLKYKCVDGCYMSKCDPLTCPCMLGVFFQSIYKTQRLLIDISRKYECNELYNNYRQFNIDCKMHDNSCLTSNYKCYHYVKRW